MEEFQRLYYDKYLFFYYNSLVINYSRLDRNKTIEILDEMKRKWKIRSNRVYRDVCISQSRGFVVRQKIFHQSIRNLNKLYVLNGYAAWTFSAIQNRHCGIDDPVWAERRCIWKSKIRQVKKDFRESLLQGKWTAEKFWWLVWLQKLIELDSQTGRNNFFKNWSNLFSAQKKKMEVILRFSITKPGWKKNCLSKGIKTSDLYMYPLWIFFGFIGFEKGSCKIVYKMNIGIYIPVEDYRNCLAYWNCFSSGKIRGWMGLINRKTAGPWAQKAAVCRVTCAHHRGNLWMFSESISSNIKLIRKFEHKT